MGRNKAGGLEAPIAPTKQQFKIVCKVFEVRGGRREKVKKTVDKFYESLR